VRFDLLFVLKPPLAGQAVIEAAKKGTVFPLKKRDIMLNYIISLMATEEKNALNLELLHTQVLKNCTSLVFLSFAKEIQHVPHEKYMAWIGQYNSTGTV